MGRTLVEIWSPDRFTRRGRFFGIALSHRPRAWERVETSAPRSDAEQVDELIPAHGDRRVTLLSRHRHVTEKMVVQKSAVKAGDVLYRLANLSLSGFISSLRYELPVCDRARQLINSGVSQTLTGRGWFIIDRFGRVAKGR